MSKKHKDERQTNVQYASPNPITPYIGQWIYTSVPSIGPVVAYVITFNPASGLADLWVYRPGSVEREYMQLHYRNFTDIRPYNSSFPSYQQAPYFSYPPSPAAYDPYLRHPGQQRSCRNYAQKSQQLACYLGMLPPV